MEQENSSSKILKEFADKTQRSFHYVKSPYEETYEHWVKRVWHQRKIYIPNSSKGSSFFVSYADAKSVNLNSENALYSGVFIPVNLPSIAKISIRKKDILDKINVFSKNQFLKSGFGHFDKRATIRGNDTLSAQKLLKSRKIQDAILESFLKEESLVAGVNKADTDFVTPLKNQSVLGIYSISGWIFDPELIEFLFERLEKIKKLLQY